jgi:hypothetical protein
MADMVPAYIPGLRLAREFYAAVVCPLLEEYFPRVPYAAALLGPGSEVIGFDSQRSVDHDWGPRVQVFLTDGDATQAAAVTAMLAGRLPESFRGYPVAFPVTPEPGGDARHRVEVIGLGAWLTGRLGFDPRREVTLLDWLATPAQRLAEFTAGEVFHDGPGELTRARACLAWYPREVWLYVLACQWQRIGQEEAFPGRCAEAGDDLGSVIVTARLARDLMRLCLLMHHRYPPYSKWLGTAFARLPGTARLGATLTAAISAGDWRSRERHLARPTRPSPRGTTSLASPRRWTPRYAASMSGPTRSSTPSGSPRRCGRRSLTRSCGTCRPPARSTSSSTAPTLSVAFASCALALAQQSRNPSVRPDLTDLRWAGGGI